MEGRTNTTGAGARARTGTRTRIGIAGTAVILLLVLALCVPVTAWASSAETLEALADKAGCRYEDILTSALVSPGESVSDWIAIATGCSGNPVKRSAYLRGLEEYVTQAYEEDGCLHRIKATEYHRISLAVLALGGDPTCFGKDSGVPIDLIAEGTYHWKGSDSLGTQGLNGWVWALITLDANHYEVPGDAAYTRESIIDAIVMAQSDEGGFGLSGDSPDVDITAMTLQALAPYYTEDARVQGSVDRALGWLSAQQSNDGDFAAWGAPAAESTAQTVIALCCLGIDPRTDGRFVKDGNSAVDGLMRYQVKDGMFRHTVDGEADVMATEQAALALIALERLDTQGARLYDLAEVTVYEGADDGADASAKPVLWIVIGVIAAAAVGGTAFVFVRRGKKNHV